MEAVTLHSQFDPTSVQFQPIGKTSKGGKIVYCNFPDNKRIQLQTPVMSAPFGISCFDEASTGLQTFSLDASFKGYDTDPKLAAFLSKCKGFDEHFIDGATARSREWLGKELTREVVANMTRGTVKEASDPTKYAPTIKFKIRMRDNVPTTEFYDESHNEVGMNYITKGTTFRAIIELSSVWFMGKNFGCTWYLSQLVVVSKPERLAGFAFKDDDA